MISASVRQLAASLGVSLVNRIAQDTYFFDGASIATRGRKYVNDDITEEFSYKDHDILHELGHWFIAEECQRDLPEYGLALGIAATAYGLKGGEFLDMDGNIRPNVPQSVFEGLVDKEEQDIQEACAQILASHWGRQLQVSPAMASSNMFTSWNQYDKYKSFYELQTLRESDAREWLKARMQAMHRLIHMGVLND